MASRVADEVSRLGYAALRFSFRGHGDSGCAQRGVTIAGEMLDLQAAVEYAASELLNRQGFIVVNGTFELGRALFEELRHYDPLARLLTSKVPTLIVQGDQDSIVSDDIARRTAALRPFCSLHTVVGADHGFDDHEDDVVNAAVAWLTEDGVLAGAGNASSTGVI
jgi:alpha/beta superfamily hydrolase